MSTTTIFKRNYPIEYNVVDPSGRRNCQRITIINVKVKLNKLKKFSASGRSTSLGHLASRAAQASSDSSPHPHRRKRTSEVDDDEDDEHEDDNDGNRRFGGGGLKNSYSGHRNT